MEKDILSSLGFNLSYESTYELSLYLYKSILATMDPLISMNKLYTDGEKYLRMLCYLTTFYTDLIVLNP